MKKFYIFITIFTILGGLMVGGTLPAKAEEKIAQNSSIPNPHLPEIYIKAVNPGYTVDGVGNVGEMIEIGKNSSDDLVSLAGLSIGYTNTSGKTATLAEFSKYIWMAGESIIIKLASSPGSELAHVRYTKTLALKAGPLALIRDGEVIDSVCWTGKDGCMSGFSSTNPTTLVRNLVTGEFEHVADYEPEYNTDNMYVEESAPEAEAAPPASQCKGMVFSEILSYYESLQSEQFIELHNNNAETVQLDGCALKYKNKYYSLSGAVGADGYFVYYPAEFKLTKNPTTSNILELVDVNGEILDRLEYPNGQRKGTSYALIGFDASGAEIWKVTYAPTPGEPNNYQEFRTCEAGKVINEATGNCVKVTSLAEKICGEGKYLNILTGRCKKIDTDSGTTECKEGYYYYEETGRCRKIKENTGADYTLVPETYEESSSFVALYLILGVVGVGLVYIIYEFRHEIMRLIRRVAKR